MKESEAFRYPNGVKRSSGFPISEAFRYPNGAGHPVDVRLARTGVERRREAAFGFPEHDIYVNTQ